MRTLCGTPSALCGTPSTLCGTPGALCSSPSTLRGTPSTLCGTPSTHQGPPPLFFLVVFPALDSCTPSPTGYIRAAMGAVSTKAKDSLGAVVALAVVCTRACA